MKKVALSLVLCSMLCGISQVASAQSSRPNNEIGISYGAGSNTLFLEIISSFFDSVFGNGVRTDMTLGPIGAEYFHNVGPTVGLGAIATYSSYKDSFEKSDDVRTTSGIAFMPAVKLNWVNKDYWGLYSKFGAGVSYISMKHQIETDIDSNQFTFNFQASLLGIEAGKKFRVFAEGGWGEQGILLVGFRQRF